MSHLALPSSARGSPTPSGTSSPKKTGKRRRLDRVLLDEDDDVDENDLIAMPRAKRRLNEEYDEEYDEDDHDDHQEQDQDQDQGQEQEIEGGQEGEGQGASSSLQRSGTTKRSEKELSEHARMRLERERERKRGQEIDAKGKKRRAETFLLRDQLDAEQAKRFDTFSTVALNKNAIKRLNRELYDQHASPQVSMVVAGMAKIFVADVIELAKDLQPHSAHPDGPLQPYHLKLARMHLEESGLLADRKQAKKALFRKR
ncbi:uncharacterized protein I303_101064 [Kwoniella dejecticola CBS 10117]|uniref:TAFII28-like protein domain-containing protein n=1 Tax=Kwoniella dejecticola CBS 10117 TaxID=1296121 RepID=A0A1A6AGQ5_9TREE|nr:uncharacterized protein I303_01067 [Kwoniella dejecticola CBS 10117]OBR89242.1 hypothetical protein I303_01067 [Kwoniella dejecticola CBS 10117]